MRSFINYESLQQFDTAQFRARRPFPFNAFEAFLTEEGFARLRQNFPAVEYFEKHENMPRGNYQRPHNRFYLAYESSIYHPGETDAPGVIQHRQLPGDWQGFLDELMSEKYLSFIKTVLGVKTFTVRYAWHIAVSGCEVSPHRDAGNKAGTHILYFNTRDEWSDEWGGATLVLSDKRTPNENPEFEDFESAEAIPFLDNRSFLFRNTPDAWHGVRTLELPPGVQRRVFNVIFEIEQRPRRWQRWLRR